MNPIYYAFIANDDTTKIPLDALAKEPFKALKKAHGDRLIVFFYAEGLYKLFSEEETQDILALLCGREPPPGRHKVWKWALGTIMSGATGELEIVLNVNASFEIAEAGANVRLKRLIKERLQI